MTCSLFRNWRSLLNIFSMLYQIYKIFTNKIHIGKKWAFCFTSVVPGTLYVDCMTNRQQSQHQVQDLNNGPLF